MTPSTKTSGPKKLDAHDSNASLESDSNSRKSLRWAIYTVLIALALGQSAGKILSVNDYRLVRLEEKRVARAIETHRTKLTSEGIEGDELSSRLAEYEAEELDSLRLQRPFLSANDRSRWLAIRALAENGNFHIEPILEEPRWDTIDMVKHVGHDGEEHLYSSKPPLLITLLAIPYWIVMQVSGMTLGTHPYELGRGLLLCINGLALSILLVAIAKLVERFGSGDYDRIAMVAFAAFGTMLSAFTPVLNNHLIATAAVAVACAGWARLMQSDKALPGTAVLTGFAAAFATANELPALALVGVIAVSLLVRRSSETLKTFIPAALLVGVAFFATNYWAHATIWPPYSYRHSEVAGENWYDYEYTVKGVTRDSYWRNSVGIDRGEASQATYAMHTTIGHHGIFSLTPMWVLSVAGIFYWLSKGSRAQREFALGTLAITLACLYFFIMMRPLTDRNYGGMTSGFRWMFWLAPLWISTALPIVDRLSRSRIGLAIVGTLLIFSTLSASYPTWNPWTQPWIYQWLDYLGFTLI